MTITIEEGKWYCRADGTVHGPAHRLGRAASPWLVGYAYYTDGGYFYEGESNHYLNLVAEVPNPADVAAQAAVEATSPDVAIALRAGKTYRTTTGKLVTLTETNNPHWPFKASAPGTEWGLVYYKNAVSTCNGDASEELPDYQIVSEEALPSTPREKVHQMLIDCGLDPAIHMLPEISPAEALQDLHDAETFDIKADIADEAKRIVSGARRSAYGKPEQNFERIARYWDAYFKNTGRDANITAADVSPLMIFVKMARTAETPAHYDSWVDVVGYALTAAEVNSAKKDVP